MNFSLSMFEKIRTRIGKRIIRREQKGLDLRRRLTNLPAARKIGILYTLDDVPDYQRVADFVNQLQHDHKEVKALGFVKNKNLIERFLPKLSYDFFSNRDINWFYRPNHILVRDFIEKEFDLLIDLSLHDLLPLKYIAGLSRAFCRVGKFSPDNKDYYDLMITWKPSMTVDDFLGQVRYYLTIIQTNVQETSA